MFNVGDFVECIKQGGNGMIRVGHVYKIIAFHANDNSVQVNNGTNFHYRAKLFVPSSGVLNFAGMGNW